MRNSHQKSRLASRNTAIYTDYQQLTRKKIRTDHIVRLLSEQYFLSERAIREIVRQKATGVPMATSAKGVA